ncbi:hypothetical protein HKBW3S43_00058 [Candidatus Hakubella thermalkaliphila]|uniref:Uncharacterized protein n=1 Tax=Candidatus Hakubella thermalkaliphila TaxID=2754717 RepID=A0A6V8PPV6_9ACTN|nr:hypothetical protein HKBW3S43_00058 [Candidatus Hakubella thermalkaliphila]
MHLSPDAGNISAPGFHAKKLSSDGHLPDLAFDSQIGCGGGRIGKDYSLSMDKAKLSALKERNSMTAQTRWVYFLAINQDFEVRRIDRNTFGQASLDLSGIKLLF